MAGALTWLPKVLEDAGLKVATVEGWELRGGEMGTVRGVICHHTANPRRDLNMPSLRVLRDGRSDLPGPLSQLGLGRDGTYYIIASGRANHAGRGEWNGITAGNTNLIGIEAENSGRRDDPWPAVQLDAYHRGVAAILREVGRTAASCCVHSEYARPSGRKTDPNFEMDAFRQRVAAILGGAAAPPVLIAVVETGGQARRTLRRGDTGELVTALQQRLGMPDGQDVY